MSTTPTNPTGNPVAYYNALPPHAETRGREERTARFISQTLKALDIPHTEGVGGHGVVAVIDSGIPGPVVMFRADMDALPYANPDGSMTAVHACGHDAHAAMLVGAAEILMACRDSLAGSVRLLFQPAEETGQGARLLIEQGALEGVSMTFGLHLLAGFKPGWLSASTGASAPAASRFTIKIRGKTTHGARPEAGVDATLAASALGMNLQSIVCLEMSP